MAPTATSPPLERTERAEALARLLRSVADMCDAERVDSFDEALDAAAHDLHQASLRLIGNLHDINRRSAQV